MGLRSIPTCFLPRACCTIWPAFAPYQAKGEHGDVAARESESILRDAGFPMAKFPSVQAAMRGHMYYSDPGSDPNAIVLT